MKKLALLLCLSAWALTSYAQRVPTLDNTPLGLPANAGGDPSSIARGKVKEYSCLTFFSPQSGYSKCYYKGFNCRSENYDGEGNYRGTYMLFLVPDGAPMSGACYMVDDKRKTILKIPLNQFKNAPLSGNTPILASLMEKNRENITETDVVEFRDRWCAFKHDIAVYDAEVFDDIHSRTDYSTHTERESSETDVWTDLATGIVLRSDDLWTAGIKIGPQPESLFKLPEGYQVTEFSAMLQNAEETMGNMLDGIGAMKDKLEGLKKSTENKSVEDLMKMLGN